MRYFVVDAFADRPFGGNPAGVCLVDTWPDDALLQHIAAENNLSETAFVARRPDGDWDLRWFTPRREVDLCGHATLGTAFVLSRFVDKALTHAVFHTLSGPLLITRRGDLFELDLPARPPHPIEILPLMTEALGVRILEAHVGERDHLLLVDSEKLVRTMQPKFQLIAKIPDCFGVIVTARGEECDFVSRFFAPAAGVDEDPVTGSSHATLVPFWAERLGKTDLVAEQVSERGGTLYCSLSGDRVKVAGRAALYLEGEIFV